MTTKDKVAQAVCDVLVAAGVRKNLVSLTDAIAERLTNEFEILTSEELDDTRADANDAGWYSAQAAFGFGED